jgi:hypothetical protein
MLLLCAIYLTGRVVRWGSWIALRGPRVVIPWSTSGLPKYTPHSFLRRTRDRSRLSVCKEDYCDLVFWTHSPTFNAMSLLIDAATGFTGAVAVAVDCGLKEIGGGSWLISAGPFGRGPRSGAGPYYAPESSFASRAIARVDIARYINPLRLREDLEQQIREPIARSKGAAVFSFLFGDVSNRFVTCSGLIGKAILRQENTPFGRALRQALYERRGRAGVTPGDLARAAAILDLFPRRLPAEPRKQHLTGKL